MRNSFDEVYGMDSRGEFPIIKQPVLKTENRVLRTGCFFYEYSPYIYVLPYYIYVRLADCFPADYPLSKSGLNRWVLSMAWSNSH